MQLPAVLLVAREQHADRPRDRPGRERLQDRGDRALGVGGAEAVQPIAPAHEQVRRRRVALVGGHGVDVRVEQQRAARRRRSARRRRRGRRRRPPRRTPRPARAARPPGAARAAARPRRDCWVSNETSSARRSTRRSAVAIAEGYTMSARPCRPPPSRPRAASLAQASARRRPRARAAAAPAHHRDAHAATPPVIDGRLDDPVWAAAAAVGRVRAALSRTRARRPASAPTVRVLYDDKNLYVGIDCEQVNAPIVQRLARRDSQIPSDGVWIDIDSRRDRRGRVPLRGQRRRRAVRRHPLRRHRLLQRLGRGLGGEGRRHRPRLRDRVPHPAVRCCASRRCPCRTGASRCGASSTRARRPTTGRSTRAAPRPTCRCSAASTTCAICSRATPSSCARSCSGAPATAPPTPTPTARRTAGRPTASAGLDAKAHVTNELTLDLTLNPDFGQVEADTRRPEPVDVRDVLPREAPVLPGGDRRLRDDAARSSTRAASAASRRRRR